MEVRNNEGEAAEGSSRSFIVLTSDDLREESDDYRTISRPLCPRCGARPKKNGCDLYYLCPKCGKSYKANPPDLDASRGM